jgi:hypothetical protein
MEWGYLYISGLVAYRSYSLSFSFWYVEYMQFCFSQPSTSTISRGIVNNANRHSRAW